MSQNPDFGQLHGTANHIFHLKETIESAEHTVESFILEIGRWTDNYPELARDHVIRWTQIQQDLHFIEKELFSYELCSRSLWERHDIEVNYVRYGPPAAPAEADKQLGAEYYRSTSDARQYCHEAG
jgi:hypothetical protein